MKKSENEITAERSAAGKKGMSRRWGERNGKSKQIRVDREAFEALNTIPERERRAFASRAIIDAIK